jgi:hypothetical protein
MLVPVPQQQPLENVGEIAIFVAILGLIVGIAVISHRMAKQRREALAALAHSLGLSFYPDTDRDFKDRHTHRWFRQGRSQSARNRIEGFRDIRGQRFQVFMGDYRWITGSGKHTQHHNAGYLLIQPTWRALPDLVIRREHFFDKIGDALGFDDIDFESAEFSRKFMVKSADKKFAYAVVHQRMMEYLMAGEAYAIDLDDGECLFGALGSNPSPEAFRAALTWAEDFFAQWPDHLVRELSA